MSINRPFVRCARALLLSVTAVICAAAAAADPPSAFPGALAGFTVDFAGERIPYRVFGVYVMPGKSVSVEVVDGDDAGYAFEAESGTVAAKTGRKWRWTPGRGPGLARLTVNGLPSGRSMTLNAFVMVPLSQVKKGMLNGYRIGDYPAVPLRQLPIYRAPVGLVEVTPENEETQIAPHFRLKQFLCKQDGGYPKYVALRARLLLKLELILAAVNEAGIQASTFAILSGYRTPAYNRDIGNVKYSRHLWGDAADIYVDERPADGNMDDLNSDGVIDYRDAAVLYEIIDGMFGRPWYEPFTGGLGRYRKTRNHGPFVHTDTRGFRARWGT